MLVPNMCHEHHVTPLPLRWWPVLPPLDGLCPLPHQAPGVLLGKQTAIVIQGSGSPAEAVHSRAKGSGQDRADHPHQKSPSPICSGSKALPKIRRNLTPCQATGERDGKSIPLECVAVYRCHIRRTHGPTLDCEYRFQKTDMKS